LMWLSPECSDSEEFWLRGAEDLLRRITTFGIWLERLVRDVEVVGSSPTSPTLNYKNIVRIGGFPNVVTP